MHEVKNVTYFLNKTDEDKKHIVDNLINKGIIRLNNSLDVYNTVFFIGDEVIHETYDKSGFKLSTTIVDSIIQDYNELNHTCSDIPLS